MMNYRSFIIIGPVNNEGGITIILSLILLMLMTIIGVAAINTSTTETMITSADEDKRTAFYAADSAVEQVNAQLHQRFRDRWQAASFAVMTSGGAAIPLDWDFLLDGTGGFTAADPQPTPPSNWFLRYSEGVPILTGSLANGYTFDARAWNNADTQPSGATSTQAARNDTDCLVVVGAITTSPRGSRVAVEITLSGGIDGTSTVGTYTAQAGGGAGKNYNASDVGTISTGNLSTLGNTAGLF
jgi:hypothetical protein